jgi:hypothetical protein
MEYRTLWTFYQTPSAAQGALLTDLIEDVVGPGFDAAQTGVRHIAAPAGSGLESNASTPSFFADGSN